MATTQTVAEFNGGPYNGQTTILPEPFPELLHPRGDAKGRLLKPGEADFNRSMNGMPFPADVTYERYVITNRSSKRAIEISTGRIVLGVTTRIYDYKGVVDGLSDMPDTPDGDITSL